MQRKPLFWFLLCLLCLGGSAYFWQLGNQWQAQKAAARQQANPPATNAPATQAATAPHALAPASQVKPSSAKASADSRYPFRLSNTSEPNGKLIHNNKAILLLNALIDTGKPVDLDIPDALRAKPNSGSYLVQSRGPLDDQFRAALRDANAAIISYIPNNAYLVRVSDAGAQQLQANAQTQSVLPFEPYYKLDPSLLALAMNQPQALPPNGLNVTVFPDAYQQTLSDLKQLGAIVASEEPSPFGPLLKVEPAPGTLSDVASLPGVQAVAAVHSRKLANDLDRVTLGVAADPVTPTNYLNLTGTNITININDSGVDASHPDLTGRITGFPLTDTSGHGTHVTGTILGSGLESSTVTVIPQGSVTNANFRGMAPEANAFVLGFGSLSDAALQETAAEHTNILISNNSWNYDGSPAYDIEAASYDAAVRDALPEVPGSQPLVYVFSAGDDGGGFASGTGGARPDSILSPATAKNVITVGAIEEARFITNLVSIDGGTNNNDEIFEDTDSGAQVARFSARGNVGINVEGDFGRFKPDVVAPGTYIISCRSEQWDQNAYYNPTNINIVTMPNQVVTSNSFTPFSFLVPEGTVQLVVTLVTNALSLSNTLPPLSIYAADGQPPTIPGNFVGTNQITLTASGFPFLPTDLLFFGVSNATPTTVNFDVQFEIFSTNDVGNFYTVLSNLNNGVAPWYRYESGTSMAAAGISGMLVLMQQYFEQQLIPAITPSPALMKALLINGSRSVSDNYNFLTANASAPTTEGWGLPNLPDILPAGPGGGSNTVQFYDQDPNQALATGQSVTRKITLNNGTTGNGASQDLRITLVWTDPPGNPTAGVKLVNDLDLIVTNTDTGEVFYGNDFQANVPYSQATVAGNTPNIDSVNNVENVFLQGPLDGTNYTITVLGARVNVNAVTANTNNVVQDYALVVSSGDSGGVTTPFTLTAVNGGAIATNNAVSNILVLSNAVPLLNQRVGANSQFAATTNSGVVNTNGVESQWNFYVYTNTPSLTNANFTNVAFVTFLPPNLSVPRMGASGEVAPPNINATRYAGADIDLYVSRDPTLTNLNPVAINNAFKSVTRTGNETVFFTNSPAGAVYYIGVKSEDQEGAQFNLIGFAADQPFDQLNTNGTVTINMNTVPLVIPGGTSTQPSSVFLFGICTEPMTVLKAVVTNTITCQDYGDYIGALSEGSTSVVLNNHSLFVNVHDPEETLVYDDSGENDIPGSITSSGPGSLRNFTGINAEGSAWTYTIVNDSSSIDTGTINNMTITLTPEPPVGTRFDETIPADSWFYGFVDVPDNATNLTISVSGNTLPVDLYIKQGGFPTQGSFDDTAVITSQGGFLSIGKFSSPPLNPGRYFYGIFNPNNSAQNVQILVQLGLSLTPVGSENFLSVGNEPLLDDAVTYSTNHVGVNETVVSADVGVRIIHPRESDLVLTLISPQGTRVLLAENRGGLDTNGYGSGVNMTNTLPETVNGNQQSETNTINLSTNFGTLVINYNFLTIPDDMRIYYDGSRIFDSGLVSGAGTFSVNFGPGGSTSVQIVMNEAGTNPSTNGDLWNYQVTVVTEDTSYAVFSENTNLATIPIKFAVPPFGSGLSFIPPSNVFSSSFEGVLATNYSLTNASSVVDGWTNNTSNAVKVVTVPFLADTGTNVLALHKGSITRTFPTTPGQTYTVRFVNHGPPGSQGPVGWWKGEGNPSDSSGNGDNGTNINGVTYANGEVGDAFEMNGRSQHIHVPDAPQLRSTNSMTAEAWIFPTSVTGDHAILVKYDSNAPGPNQGSYSFSLGGTGVGYLLLNPTGGQNVSQFAETAPNAVPVNQWSHLAGTYDGSNIKIYLNGLLMMTQPYNQGIFPGNDDLGIGANLGGYPDAISTAPWAGEIDEATLYSNALTGVQIDDIYAAGYVGKAPVGQYTPVTAKVILGTSTNTIVGLDQWTTESYSFTAVTNTMSLTIIPNTNSAGSVQDGMLVDSFSVIRDAAANPTNYYLPEESLAKVAGERSLGDWKLEVLDNRAGPPGARTILSSWELSLVLASSVPAASPLIHAVTQTNTVQPNSIAYYFVDVPPWAQFATNFLTVISGGPLNLLFNQTIEPTGTNAADVLLFSGTGSRTLSTNGNPPLLPGQRYFLGVQNTSLTTPATFAIQVDFNITTLTNAIPDTNQPIAVGNIPRYFQFDVDTNKTDVLFQIFNASGNLELVATKGPPLPDQNNFEYIGAGSSTINITVTTNSTPVPLAPGRWYLGVFNIDAIPVTYSIVATEVGPPNIIPLTNGVPFNFSAAPGPALTNFFVFTVTNNASSAVFQLYNLSGNADLDLDLGILPYSPPFLASSTNPGTNAEQIVIRTNFVGSPNLVTNSLGATNWYLGVPNNTSNTVTYTILAMTPINGILTNGLPFHLVATVPPGGLNPVLTWPSVDGETYLIQVAFSLAPIPVTWSNLSTNLGTGALTTFTDPLSFTAQPIQFFRIIQIPP